MKTTIILGIAIMLVLTGCGATVEQLLTVNKDGTYATQLSVTPIDENSRGMILMMLEEMSEESGQTFHRVGESYVMDSGIAKDKFNVTFTQGWFKNKYEVQTLTVYNVSDRAEYGAVITGTAVINLPGKATTETKGCTVDKGTVTCDVYTGYIEASSTCWRWACN